MHFLRKGEKFKMQKIDWCEGGLQLSDIGTKNISEPYLTPRMEYIMVRLENRRQNTCTRGVIEYRIVRGTRVLNDQNRLSWDLAQSV